MDMIAIPKFSKGHNSIKMLVELWYLVYVHFLITLNICTKFGKNISSGLRVI